MVYYGYELLFVDIEVVDIFGNQNDKSILNFKQHENLSNVSLYTYAYGATTTIIHSLDHDSTAGATSTFIGSALHNALVAR